MKCWNTYLFPEYATLPRCRPICDDRCVIDAELICAKKVLVKQGKWETERGNSIFGFQIEYDLIYIIEIKSKEQTVGLKVKGSQFSLLRRLK